MSVQKLKKVPTKKRPRGETQFNLDKYIEDHLTTYSKEFTKKCKHDYGLLDKLTDSFVEFIEQDKNLPFEYRHYLTHYQPEPLEQEAINTFTQYVTSKGYTCDCESRTTDPDDYYPSEVVTITVK